MWNLKRLQPSSFSNIVAIFFCYSQFFIPPVVVAPWTCMLLCCQPPAFPCPHYGLQVCNHPELFEGQAERWPLQFAELTTAIDSALRPVTQVVHAGPGRPPKAPTSSTYVQVTGFRSHIQVGPPAGRRWCAGWA
jgi:hypothetical protein